MAVYSFADVVATINGPGGSIILGSGSGNAEEGISIESVEEKDTMQIGADGYVVHNLHASKAMRARVRLMKTSPTNAALMAMYNLQTSSSLFHGQNIIAIANPVTGDSYSLREAAFARNPNNGFAKESAAIEWEFNASYGDGVLGANILEDAT